jgi:hypothetical protein
MKPFTDVVYFLAFRRVKKGAILKFVEDFKEQDDMIWPTAGLFVFLRHEKNRGKVRRLRFLAVKGFGEASTEFTVSLRSLYPETRNSNRFICEDNGIAPFLSNLTFRTIKIPEPVQLEGSATKLRGHSLWELVPEDRLNLEQLWKENEFYFLGSGKAAG